MVEMGEMTGGVEEDCFSLPGKVVKAQKFLIVL